MTSTTPLTKYYNGFLGSPNINGRTTFQPTGPAPITYATVNTQIYVAQLASGGYTGVLATIPLPGTAGAPIPTGMMEVDVETSMQSIVSTDAARIKLSWQGSGKAGAFTVLGPLVISMAVGTNANGVPTGWNATIQGDAGTNNAQIIASIPTGVVDCKSLVQFGWSL